jgi:glycosyltransferase involved in cell wall biosynthesis
VGLVSVIVCTRNRAGQVEQTVRSLLDEPGVELELILVDQSDGPETKNALASFFVDGRLRYLASKKRGKGVALNEGLRIARGSVVVCTDDDCVVPRRWAADMANTLEARPSAAIVFCRVVAVPHDPSAGYVPVYDPPASRLLRSVVDMRNGPGLGAAMAVRRDFLSGLGGFDESFGPGGRFPSADEWDLCMRALLKGWQVYETTALAVEHDGFRSFAEGRAHARRDWLALGAVCAKPLRAGYLSASIVPLWFFPTRALWPPVSDILHLRKPRGLGRITAFLSGFARGLSTSVDPVTLRFTTGAQAKGF